MKKFLCKKTVLIVGIALFLCCLGILVLQTVVSDKQPMSIGYGICAMEWDQSEELFPKVSIELPQFKDSLGFNIDYGDETLQIENVVYSLKRQGDKESPFVVSIEFPQLKGTSDFDMDKVNALIKDMAFAACGKTSYDAIKQLEKEWEDLNSDRTSVHVSYEILNLEQDYISLVFMLQSFTGGPSYMHQYLVTVDLKNARYVYFNEFADMEQVLEAVQAGDYKVYAGTYSEVSEEYVHKPDMRNRFVQQFKDRIEIGVPQEGIDCFSSQNIGLDKEYLYIYFLFDYSDSFHGYYILCIPRKSLTLSSVF